MPYYVVPQLYFPLRYFSAQYCVDPHLVLAVVMQESAADPVAVGDERHSFGLMQLHVEGAGAGHGPADLLDLARNLEIGIAHLAEMITATHSIPDGLSAYNQGLGSWAVHGRATNPGYVKDVLWWQSELQQKGWDWDHSRILIREAQL